MIQFLVLSTLQYTTLYSVFPAQDRYGTSTSIEKAQQINTYTLNSKPPSVLQPPNPKSTLNKAMMVLYLIFLQHH